MRDGEEREKKLIIVLKRRHNKNFMYVMQSIEHYILCVCKFFKIAVLCMFKRLKDFMAKKIHFK